MNARGRNLLETCTALNLRILNGRIVGDLEGKQTCFHYNGSSVVDYVIGSKCILRNVQYLIVNHYCAFHKHANSKVQKPPSQLCFSLPSVKIKITSNEPGNTETHKTDRNPPITNQKPWPFEPVKVKFCFLRGPLRWLTAAKNAIVSWVLNFRIRMSVKSAVRQWLAHFEAFTFNYLFVKIL